MKYLKLSPRKIGIIADRVIFGLLRMFGLLLIAWRYCPVYPKSPYWLMLAIMLLLAILTMLWTIACMPICFAIAALADWLIGRLQRRGTKNVA